MTINFNTLNKGLALYLPLDQTHKNGAAIYSDLSAQSNHGTAVNSPTATTDRFGVADKALAFDGTSDYIDIGNIGKTIKTIAFWVRPDSVSKSIMDLDGGTHKISVASGTIAATGFNSPTIYVNGSASSTLTVSAWQYVVITTATGFLASDVDIGRIAAAYFSGNLYGIRFYLDEKNQAEVTELYQAGGIGNIIYTP